MYRHKVRKLVRLELKANKLKMEKKMWKWKKVCKKVIQIQIQIKKRNRLPPRKRKLSEVDIILLQMKKCNIKENIPNMCFTDLFFSNYLYKK